MDRKYYLHRISHESNISYSLMGKGYLTLGWGKYSDKDIINVARSTDTSAFRSMTKDNGDGSSRSRWDMWYFSQFNVGDYILVPLYNGLFSIYEAVDIAKGISLLEQEEPNIAGEWNDNSIVWLNNKLYDDTEKRVIDIGFYIMVKPIVKEVPRKFVDGKLFSRMKIRSGDADISDLSESIENAIKVGKTGQPISLYERSMSQCTDFLKVQLREIIDYNRFEELIKWYVEKIGADYSEIPGKNEPGKKDGADADIVAEFKNLKHIVYIQAKHHKGETADWAVTQIKEYFNQKAELDSDYSYAKWVISTCDDYTEEAKKAAEEFNVRLINGEEFARMLLDIGLKDLDTAFSNKK